MFDICLTARIPRYDADEKSAPGTSVPLRGGYRAEGVTWVCAAFAERQRSVGMIVATGRGRISLEHSTMPGDRGHKRSEVRTDTSLARRVRQRRCLCTPQGLSRPLTTTRRRACPSTLPNPARIGCAPGPSRPGPGLMGALLPRDPQRHGLRAPTPRASVSTLDQDERFRCSITG
jgi:hypothetical protein